MSFFKFDGSMVMDADASCFIFYSSHRFETEKSTAKEIIFMPRLTEQEQQEILRFMEADRPLPDKYRFLLFADKRESTGTQ